MISLLESKDYKSMPWKNGKGQTAEIALHKDDENAFRWRLSSAEISEDGNFSEYPGFERFLTLTEGAGIQLTFSDHREACLKQGEVWRFSGDGVTHCQLLQGTVKDLGLIFNPNQVEAKFEILNLSQGPRSFQPEGRTVLFFGLTSQAKITVLQGEEPVLLSVGETARIDFPSDLSKQDRIVVIESMTSECSVVFIDLKY